MLCCLVALLLTCVAGLARDQWTIRDKVYDVDTVIVPHLVGPGMTCVKYHVQEIPLLVNVLEMDLTNPYAMMEPCLGGGYAVGLETPLSMAERNDWPGHDVVGAINGDFFNNQSSKEMGIPMSGQVTNGELLVSSHNRACFVLDDDNCPYVDRLTFTGSVTCGETSFPLYFVNRMRYGYEDIAADQTILFTHAFGPATYAGDVTGKMLVLKPVDEPFKWLACGSEHCIIESIIEARKSTPIPEGRAILLLKGARADYADSMNEGDELTITLHEKLNRNNKEVAIKQMIGGSNHLFMWNGEYNPSDAWDERHPRTAIGYTADSTRVFFVVVDGRQTASAGVTLRDLSDIFKNLGAAFAVNLDGGGSSVLMVNDEIINNPSEGPVRTVGNGCLFVSNAPVDDEIGIISFEPRHYSLSASSATTFHVWGYNQYGVLKTRDLQGCTFSCDPEVGYFDDQGVFNAASTSATGNLYVTYNGLTASHAVTVIDSHWDFQCDSVVIDRFHKYAITVIGVSEYGVDFVDPTVVDWYTDDADVCVVDDRAFVSAVGDGMTFVRSTSSLLSDSLLVRVENPRELYDCIEDAPIDPETWNVSQSGGKNRVVTALDNGLQIDFTGASSRNPYIKLTKTVQLWGLPDSLRFRIQADNIRLKSVKMLVETAQGNRVTLDCPVDNSAGGEFTIEVPVSDICNPRDLSNYPLRLLYYYISHEQVTTDESYSVRIPGMELVYSYMRPVFGDVNGDKEISIADVNAVIDMILTDNQSEVGDVNGDGEVNIADVDALIDMLLL